MRFPKVTAPRPPAHLQRQADRHLARRCSSAILIYPSFLLILAVFTTYYRDQPALFLKVAAATLLINALRLPLSRRLDSLPDSRLDDWRRAFFIIVLTNGLLWGCFLAWTLLSYGHGRLPSSILLVSVAGAAAGSIAAHGSHLVLVSAYVSSLLIPSMIVQAGLLAGDDGTGMLLIFTLYLAFLLEQARRYNGLYWKMLTDDDQLRARTAELELARAAAEEASTAKSAFLANVTHELRTPLNAIIGYTEMLLEDSASPHPDATVAQEDLGRILYAARHQLRLVNDLLDFAKVEAGQLQINNVPFDFHDLASEIAESVRPLASRNRNRLELALPPEPLTVTGDALRVSQSLYNLLSNACKFTHDGLVRLSVDSVDRDGRPWVECRVSDTGIGITPEQMELLFQPFHQADNSTARRFGGTGLGLALTRDLCTLMGGVVEAQSQAGRGSTFTFRIPIDPAAPDPATPPVAPPTRAE
ncbi:MAG: ATP-binding protein [Bryobacteraceae bacterium]